MDQPVASAGRHGRFRASLLGGAVLVMLALAGAAWRMGSPDWLASLRVQPPSRPQPIEQPRDTPAPPTTTQTGSEARSGSSPTFDVVRVSPQGQAVLAGRATAGAEVVVAQNGQEVGRATADQHGQWVLVPGAPLAAGARVLTLAARDPGGASVAGETPVTVIVPDAVAANPAPAGADRPGNADAGKSPAASPIVVATPLDGPALVLQGALAPAPGDVGPARPGRLGLDAVDYDETGAIRFAGHAPAGATLRTYIDDRPAGEARAGPQGRWTLVPDGGVGAGSHRVRVDQVAANGRVVARAELPIQRAVVSQTDVAEGHVVVQPRQTLWRIARRAYGKGVRYTDIYNANRAQIADPNRIYPGQVFSVPNTDAPSVLATAGSNVSPTLPSSPGQSRPASSSRSR